MNVRRRKIMDEKKYLESILKGNKKKHKEMQMGRKDKRWEGWEERPEKVKK